MPARRRHQASRPSAGSILAKTKMCRFHILGACPKGDSCNYAHAKEEMHPLPDLYRTKLCKTLISTGECADPTCKYAHSSSELRPLSAPNKGDADSPSGSPENRRLPPPLLPLPSMQQHQQQQQQHQQQVQPQQQQQQQLELEQHELQPTQQPVYQQGSGNGAARKNIPCTGWGMPFLILEPKDVMRLMNSGLGNQGNSPAVSNSPSGCSRPAQFASLPAHLLCGHMGVAQGPLMYAGAPEPPQQPPPHSQDKPRPGRKNQDKNRNKTVNQHAVELKPLQENFIGFDQHKKDDEIIKCFAPAGGSLKVPSGIVRRECRGMTFPFSQGSTLDARMESEGQHTTPDDTDDTDDMYTGLYQEDPFFPEEPPRPLRQCSENVTSSVKKMLLSELLDNSPPLQQRAPGEQAQGVIVKNTFLEVAPPKFNDGPQAIHTIAGLVFPGSSSATAASGPWF